MCRRMRHLKPREIQGCRLALDSSISSSLYDATSGGSLVAADGTVARWEDQSGNAWHVTQSTSGNRPMRKVAYVNGGDSLLFDGTTDFLSRASCAMSDLFSGGTDTSLFIVQVQDGSQADNTQIGIITGSERFVAHLSYTNVLYFDAAHVSTARVSVAQPSGWDDGVHVADGVRRTTYERLFTNNVLRVSRSDVSGSVTSATATLNIGTFSSSFYHKGSLCEVVVIQRGLDEYNAARFRHSRMRKWRVNG